MRFLFAVAAVFFLSFFIHLSSTNAETFSKRFEKGSSDFGAQVGWGHTFDLPPGRDRINIGFLYFFPNWQHNVSGLIGKGWYRGALYLSLIHI